MFMVYIFYHNFWKSVHYSMIEENGASLTLLTHPQLSLPHGIAVQPAWNPYYLPSQGTPLPFAQVSA